MSIVIKYEELIAALEQHPDFKEKWYCPGLANRHLTIEFADPEGKVLIHGDDYRTPSIMEVIMDVAEDGFLYSMEFY